MHGEWCWRMMDEDSGRYGRWFTDETCMIGREEEG